MRLFEKYQSGLKYYINQYGYLYMIWQNPCGCHHYDILIRNEFMKRDSSMSFENQQQINGYVRRHKLERLK